eukprot:TRINITY_DN9833_c0_g1_i1.p1 TRINITY_DN9833_c0_g1~~TRINITY_DN9833_c0_g1_i1.p1  ORF type:complete len:1053 (-),score=216.06 TRINITY_DN9833_c0_g1_i1:401-3313(-)
MDKFLATKLAKDQEKAKTDRHNNIDPNPKKKGSMFDSLLSKKKEEPNQSFEIISIGCGSWSTETTDPIYLKQWHHEHENSAILSFEPRDVRVTFSFPESSELGPDLTFIESREAFLLIPTNNIESIFINQRPQPSIYFSLYQPPKFYLKINTMFDHVHLSEGSRVCSFGNLRSHKRYASTSFVYSFQLLRADDFHLLMELKAKHGTPPPEYLPQLQIVSMDHKLLQSSLEDLELVLRTRFSYTVAFQLNALRANGYLLPQTILLLLPDIVEFEQNLGPKLMSSVLQSFHEEISYKNVTRNPGSLSLASLKKTLCSSVKRTVRVSTDSGQGLKQQRQARMAIIHRAVVTPVGTYFSGPSLEKQNRVLRKYPDHHDHFLRVTFSGEDGDQLLFEQDVDQGPVYERFKRVMNAYSQDDRIEIAGRVFKFLGFSSSSLRTQSCWFVAPFELNGAVVDGDYIISQLGDFKGITCVGRCAARIGQAFSDTINSIHVGIHSENVIPDVTAQQNGLERVFSDGVGTISREMLKRIWSETDVGRGRPTVLQVRFMGAKGVLALDERLQGDQLCLRPSMVKFQGSQDRNIEICSFASQMEMLLNRPLIKVLEDRGVDLTTFRSLQKQAISVLREASTSAKKAAAFFKFKSIGAPSFKLARVIKGLADLGLNFSDDPFLAKVLELSLLMSLRDLKHRARIPVPNGFTLMGVMDETRFLEEGQIFVPIYGEDGWMAPHGPVLVARSPVHHPGDVQMATAVRLTDLPPKSPLLSLKNCVVFSQKGSRDLPSKLGGGDLDGDIYNLIFDKRFFLNKEEEAADYPRQTPKDLGREVKSTDIVDFFVGYMQNDLVGPISTRHLIIADQAEEGVYHKDCLKLAQQMSIAVDYPKTGNPVEMRHIPRTLSKVRPDYMAPGPRVLQQGSRRTLSCHRREGLLERIQRRNPSGTHSHQRPQRIMENLRGNCRRTNLDCSHPIRQRPLLCL